MTINSTTRKTSALVGNGNTATYPFAFKVFTDADVVVKKLEAATSIETTLTPVSYTHLTLPTKA